MKPTIFLVSSLTFYLVGSSLRCSPSLAQVTPDGTTSTTVNADGDNFTIEQGDRVGDNLFHSFDEFSVPTLGEAAFNNASDIANIFSRVTGSNISSIDGLIRANGAANLFLINPNGIIFGQNARLNLGGSFFASTADSLLFDNGLEFSASNPTAPPLIEVNIPVGLGFRDNPGEIINRSQVLDGNDNPVGLQMQPGKNITFAGGNITFDGGTITAPGGRIELGGLSAAGTIGISYDGSLSFPDDLERADLQLTNDASVNVRAGGGGSITINARNIELSEGSTLLAGIELDMGSPNAQGGDITINSTGSVSLINGSQLSIGVFGQGNGGNVIINAKDEVLFNGVSSDGFPSAAFSTIREEGEGNAGKIEIKAGSLNLENGGRLETSTRNQGNAGNITIDIEDAVTISGFTVFNEETTRFSQIASILDTNAQGSPGSINITASSLTLENGSQLNSSTSGEGDSGSIEINTDNLSLINEARIGANTFNQGNAGNINIKAKSFSSSGSFVSSSVAENATGKGGKLTITTDSLSLSEGSIISTSTLGKAGENGRSNAGSIEINISNSLEATDGSFLTSVTFGEGDAGDININGEGATVSFDGVANNAIPSSIFTFTSVPQGAVGRAGNISIKVRSLFLTDGAQLNSDTSGEGDAGNITIEAEGAVELSDPNTAIFTDVGSGAIGNGGDINIKARSLSLTDGAQLDAGTSGQGNTGNITLNVSDTISLDNGSDSQIRVQPGATGNGGNINIQARTLSLANGSEILTETFGEGKAGNIQVDVSDSVILSGFAPFPVLEDGSTGGFSSGLITGTEEDAQGQGGDISVNTNRLRISDGAVLSARSTSDFQGGNIEVNANVLEVTSGGQLITTAFSQGNAGNINLNISDRILFSGSDPKFFDRFNQIAEVKGESEAIARIDPVSPFSGIFANTTSDSTGQSGQVFVQTGQLSLENGARFAVNSQGEGNGGSISISTDNLTLNNASQISAATASGEGGKINLTIAEDIILENNSSISARAFGNANGGNVTIDAADGFIIAFPNQNNDIVANAERGNGGNINITTQAIFGLEERRSTPPNQTNDIDASSQFGLQGSFSLNTLENEPSRGLVDLPENVVNAEDLISQNVCKQGANSKFTLTGRGGLPATPDQMHSSEEVEVDLVEPAIGVAAISNEFPVAEDSTKIVPAKGWIRNEQGEVILVGYDPTKSQISPQPEDLDLCQPQDND